MEAFEGLPVQRIVPPWFTVKFLLIKFFAVNSNLPDVIKKSPNISKSPRLFMFSFKSFACPLPSSTP